MKKFIKAACMATFVLMFLFFNTNNAFFCNFFCAESVYAQKCKMEEQTEHSNKIFREFDELAEQSQPAEPENQNFIKWVDFNVSDVILKEAYYLDVKFHNTDVDFKFVNALAYLTALNGNKFNSHTDKKNLSKLLYRLENKETMADIAKDLKYYDYYVECYSAILGGMIGEYKCANDDVEYGLKAYYPIAEGFWNSHFDDFGNDRSFGFKRKHLGHDIFGSVGTPIVAIEGGEVTELEWNRYGGWTISVRSHDKKRIYYYAHLRKNSPYAENLKLGDIVMGGQVIGYMGNTGYSYKENSNMDCDPHLHLGLQLVFDESQVRGSSEIWIDLYNLTKFLNLNTVKTQRNAETKQHKSIDLRIPV